VTERTVAVADLGAGLFVLGLAALAGWGAYAIPPSPSYATIGARLAPLVCAAVLAICGVGLTIIALRGGWSAELEEVREAPPVNIRAVGLVGAGLLANLTLIDWLGFVIAATAQFALTARGLGSRSPVRDVLIGLGVTVASYLFFDRVLGANIGAGVLERVL
jgi:putative tricarboxylic transport membrane protein